MTEVLKTLRSRVQVIIALVGRLQTIHALLVTCNIKYIPIIFIQLERAIRIYENRLLLHAFASRTYLRTKTITTISSYLDSTYWFQVTYLFICLMYLDTGGLFLWAQSLFVLAQLLTGGLLHVNELDPIRRYLPSYNRPRRAGRYSAFQVGKLVILWC